MSRRAEVIYAWSYGLVTHAVFAVAVVVMVASLIQGLKNGLGPFHGWTACLMNALLIVQFPILHSYFLTPGGRTLMSKMGPQAIGKDLVSTTFVLIASIQLLVAFLFWSPSILTILKAAGWAYVPALSLCLASWLFLIKALTDAGLGLQMGFTGWTSVVRGQRPEYGTFSTHGLFCWFRHPVYLGFALVMWTNPVLTVDGLVLALLWTAYCLIGPLFKESRYRGWFGERYIRYCRSVPYMLPKIKRARLPNITGS